MFTLDDIMLYGFDPKMIIHGVINTPIVHDNDIDGHKIESND